MDLATLDRAIADGAVVVDVRPAMRLRRRPPRRVAQRRPRRPLRRAGRQPSSTPTRRSSSSATPTPRPRPGCASPGSASTACVGASTDVESVARRRTRARQPPVAPHRQRALDERGPRSATLLASSTSASPARSPPHRSRAPATSRSPALRDRPRRPRPGSQPRSCCAPAGHGRRSPAASCGPRASPTSPTCSAAPNALGVGDGRRTDEPDVIAAASSSAVPSGWPSARSAAADRSWPSPSSSTSPARSATAATATSLVAVGSAAAVAATGHRRNVRSTSAAVVRATGFAGALLGAHGRQAPRRRRAAARLLRPDARRRPPHDGDQAGEATFALGRRAQARRR